VLPKAVYEEDASAYQVRVAGAERHCGKSIIAARMSLTPKLAITLKMPSAAAYCWQKRSTK